MVTSNDRSNQRAKDSRAIAYASRTPTIAVGAIIRDRILL